jgi:hypothetical protein
MAVYKHEPWSAVRKVRLFETDNYRKIFDREVTAARLYLLRQVADLVLSKRGDLRDDLAASFASVRFTLAYLLAQVAAEIVDSVNFFIGEEETDSRKTGGDFDPKVTFKSHSGVQRVENAVLRDYRRLVKRDPHYIFDVAPVC